MIAPVNPPRTYRISDTPQTPLLGDIVEAMRRSIWPILEVTNRWANQFLFFAERPSTNSRILEGKHPRLTRKRHCPGIPIRWMRDRERFLWVGYYTSTARSEEGPMEDNNDKPLLNHHVGGEIDPLAAAHIIGLENFASKSVIMGCSTDVADSIYRKWFRSVSV